MERAYLGIARAAGRYLTRGCGGAAVYVRGGLAGGDFVAGLSDVDLAIVLDGGAGRARGRWERLSRSLPGAALVLDWPRIYDAAELGELAGGSAFTHEGAVYAAGDRLDAIRMLERPGLYGATSDWRLLSGRDRRPSEPARDAQERRIAAWLELVYCWRLVFPFVVDPIQPRATDLAVKLVAEPARIWLWLADGERVTSRTDALRRAIVRLPEEEPALRRALELRQRLPECPPEPFAEVLPAAVRLSARIAELIAAEVAPEGACEVRLAGPGPELPLADWRGVVCVEPEATFAVGDGRPDDPVAFAAATTSAGPYAALLAGRLAVLPALGLLRTRLRAIKCPAVDPVLFALVDGAAVVAFPEVRGWSARDTARRAVVEHRAWLDTGSADRERLLSAARAALFLESVEAGEPELCVTLDEVAGRLGSGDLRGRVLRLAAYQRGDPLDD